jgi:hypothetical protein
MKGIATTSFTRHLRSALACALAAAGLVGGSAWAQENPCDSEDMRQQFQEAVEAGASEQELEERYGWCREQQGAGQTVITNSNIFFERMNGCGWHPQKGVLACDVEIRQNGGYGGFGPAPFGSYERALFCVDCNSDGRYEFSYTGAVHVTNNASGTLPSWHHLVYTTTPTSLCGPAGNGGAFQVRAILSWAFAPPRCDFRPYWGNRIDFSARRDP